MGKRDGRRDSDAKTPESSSPAPLLVHCTLARLDRSGIRPPERPNVLHDAFGAGQTFCVSSNPLIPLDHLLHRNFSAWY